MGREEEIKVKVKIKKTRWLQVEQVALVREGWHLPQGLAHQGKGRIQVYAVGENSCFAMLRCHDMPITQCHDMRVEMSCHRIILCWLFYIHF